MWLNGYKYGKGMTHCTYVIAINIVIKLCYILCKCTGVLWWLWSHNEEKAIHMPEISKEIPWETTMFYTILLMDLWEPRSVALLYNGLLAYISVRDCHLLDNIVAPKGMDLLRDWVAKKKCPIIVLWVDEYKVSIQLIEHWWVWNMCIALAKSYNFYGGLHYLNMDSGVNVIVHKVVVISYVIC